MPRTQVYANSFTAKYKILNVSNEHVFPLEVAQDGGQEMQFAMWGPRGSQLVRSPPMLHVSCFSRLAVIHLSKQHLLHRQARRWCAAADEEWSA